MNKNKLSILKGTLFSCFGVVLFSAALPTAVGESEAGVVAVDIPNPERVRKDHENRAQGFAFSTDEENIQVVALGRFVLPDNSGVHQLTLLERNGATGDATVVGIATLKIYEATADSSGFAYATLAAPVDLNVGSQYLVLSQEGCEDEGPSDLSYDVHEASLTLHSGFTWIAAAYTDNKDSGTPSLHDIVAIAFAPVPGKSYGPVSFKFQVSSPPAAVTKDK